MATVTFTPYNGGPLEAKKTNEYISNGHGDEVLVRTNRYITGDHACGNRCVGVNCPSDPALATAFMEQLRTQYETNLGGRNTKGTNAEKEPVAHYQIVFSWHPDENPSPEERYEMVTEVLQSNSRTRNHAHLLACHENEPHPHCHASTSAYSLNSHSKLAMNNGLLYELRREMDRVCVAHGYSIVEAPELWGDKEYKEWFDCVKALDVVTVHPPLPRKKRTQKQQYADAKKEEREAKEAMEADLLKARRMTPENRGTNFYGLPHVCDPAHPDRQLYIYALDKEGNRRPPLQLDFALQFIWGKKCSDIVSTSPDFPGKKELETRFGWIRENAFQAYDLVGRLDIGTRAELEGHLKAVGGDLSKYRQEVAYQSKLAATATERNDAGKLERAVARKAHAEKMLAERSDEYRRLKRAEAVLDGMDTGEHWEQFRQALMQRSTKRLRVPDRQEQMIRENYRDIGQLLGIPQAEIDRIIAEAKTATMDEIEAKWVVYSGNTRITYTQRKSGLSALYDLVGEEYADRRELRSAFYEFQRDFPVVGIVTGLLFLAIAIPLGVAEANKEAAYDLRIANAKRVAEEIRWHNKHCEDQLKRAKRALAVKLTVYEGTEADRAWLEFCAECEKLMQRTRELKAHEAALVGNRMTHSSVRDLSGDIERAKEMRSLDAIIAGAEGRKPWKEHPRKEKEQTH